MQGRTQGIKEGTMQGRMKGTKIGSANQNGNGNVIAVRAEVRPRRRDVAYLQTRLLIAQKEEAGIQLQAEEFDFMAATTDYEEIEEVNANCILMANFQQASTSGTHADKAPIYDSYGLAEDDNNVILIDSNINPSGGEVEQLPATIEEIRGFYESLYNNLVIEVQKANTINRKTREANVKLIDKLVRYRGREKSFEFNQEKFDKLKNGYIKSIYQEKCLTKKINALHLSSSKMINSLNEEIVNPNNQLSKENSTVSYLQEEREKLKNDFKTREDELLDKLIESDKKIKELDNILVKTEDDESLDKIKVLEKENERLLRAVVSQDIMSIVKSHSVIDTSNIQTELCWDSRFDETK
ncbi:hypothetical protein Tco_0534205 [Tanacetum coccineum]